MPYGRDQMAAIALDLAGRGFAVWNLEYRRLGVRSSGWPGTFQDVVTGIEHLSNLVADGTDLDLNRITVVGHSAGGHLALWAAAHNRDCRKYRVAKRVRIAAVVGQAAVTDLIRAHHLGLGSSAVAEFLGATPNERMVRYEAASPIALLPLRIPQLVMHGTADDIVPIEISRTYTQAARAAGDTVEFVELPGAGHMEYLDPSSEAHRTLCEWLTRLPSGS